MSLWGGIVEMGSELGLSTVKNYTAKGLGNMRQNSYLWWPELILTTLMLSWCWFNSVTAAILESVTPSSCMSSGCGSKHLHSNPEKPKSWLTLPKGSSFYLPLPLTPSGPSADGDLWSKTHGLCSETLQLAAPWDGAELQSPNTPFDTCLSPSLACDYRKISFIAGCHHLQDFLAMN